MNHEKVVVELELDDILPNRFQPRFKFHEQAINELAESIKEHGVIQPILVRKLGDKYEIIAGERRYKASLLAGKRTIPAIIAELNDKDSAEVALIENVQRQDLTPIEEAVSYRKILDMGYLTQEQLAEKLGKNQSTISNKLRLLNLDDSVQEALLDEKISERHARSLLKISSKQTQQTVLNKIIKERLTVKKTDDLINKILSGEVDLNSNSQETVIPSILMNNSVQAEESAIQSSSAIEFINSDNQVLNSFGKEENKASEIFDFLNNEKPKEEMIPTESEEINEVPIIQNLEAFDNNISKEEVASLAKYDIPSSPIVEEIEEESLQNANLVNNEHELKEIDQMINNMPQDINPGFVDVDNIEKNAKDIYVEKPLADIDNLLATQNVTPLSGITGFDQINNESKLEEKEQVSQNKFFTMFTPEEDEEQKDNESDNSSNEESFNFNPIIENDNNINKFLNNEQQQPIDNNVNNINSNEPFSFANEESKIINIENNIDNNYIVDNVEVEKKDANNIDFVENIEEIEDSPKTINYPADNILAESVRKEETMEIKNIETNNETVIDLKTVINTIRNCSDTIEKYGFAIECEEYDFEDMYQVIFKIQKKDKF